MFEAGFQVEQLEPGSVFAVGLGSRASGVGGTYPSALCNAILFYSLLHRWIKSLAASVLS